MARHEAQRRIMRMIFSEGFSYAVTPNAEFVVIARRDPSFRRILWKADLALPDGVSLIWVARRLGFHIPERIPGVEMFFWILEQSAKLRFRIFLLGSKPKTVEKALERARAMGAAVCGCYHGFFGAEEEASVAYKIRESGAQVLFVGMGAGKQELFIGKWGAITGVNFAMGIGGSIDVLAGEEKRAPDIFLRLNGEWLYRTVFRPGRWRKLVTLAEFAALAVGEILRRKTSL